MCDFSLNYILHVAEVPKNFQEDTLMSQDEVEEHREGAKRADVFAVLMDIYKKRETSQHFHKVSYRFFYQRSRHNKLTNFNEPWCCNIIYVDRKGIIQNKTCKDTYTQIVYSLEIVLSPYKI